MATKEEIKEHMKLDTMTCPMCGSWYGRQYKSGKYKGLFRCNDCQIRFTQPKIYQMIEV